MNTTLVVRYHEGIEPLVPKYHSICRISITTTTRTRTLTTARHDCAACRMTKMTAPWVRQKAAGLTADGNVGQLVLERVIICEDCYACQVGTLA